MSLRTASAASTAAAPRPAPLAAAAAGSPAAGSAARVAPDFCRCRTLVLGCGNELFGDDGFGCAVARRLAGAGGLPEGMLAMDVGTGARQVLFDVVLSPEKPRRLLVVDAVDMGRAPGEVWSIEAQELPEVKCDDFSMHQLPTSNLLRELAESTGVEVRCVVAQVASLPSEVAPGLSGPVRRAVEEAVRIVRRAGSEPDAREPSYGR